MHTHRCSRVTFDTHRPRGHARHPMNTGVWAACKMIERGSIIDVCLIESIAADDLVPQECVFVERTGPMCGGTPRRVFAQHISAPIIVLIHPVHTHIHISYPGNGKVTN